MVGLKRRTRVEGWALDVSEGEEVGYKSTLQRLGDNNRLWVATFIVLVLVSGFLMRQAKHDGAAKSEDHSLPRLAKMNGDYLNQEHKDFVTEFLRDKGRGVLLVEARFVNDRTFRFVVPGDTSADDIEYISKMVAELNRARFKTRITVEAYQRSAATGTDTLRATTNWVVPRYGFVVRFIDRAR